MIYNSLKSGLNSNYGYSDEILSELLFNLGYYQNISSLVDSYELYTAYDKFEYILII